MWFLAALSILSQLGWRLGLMWRSAIAEIGKGNASMASVKREITPTVQPPA
jgi:hypothetical protein